MYRNKAACVLRKCYFRLQCKYPAMDVGMSESSCCQTLSSLSPIISRRYLASSRIGAGNTHFSEPECTMPDLFVLCQNLRGTSCTCKQTVNTSHVFSKLILSQTRQQVCVVMNCRAYVQCKRTEIPSTDAASFCLDLTSS